MTGGSSGLGLELVTAFARNGARVVIAALEKDAVEAVTKDVQAEGLDVTGFQVINNSITGDKLTDDAMRDVIGTTKDDAVSESKTYTGEQIDIVKAWATATFVAQDE